MHGFQRSVCVRGDDGERRLPLVRLSLPGLVETCKQDQSAIGPVETDGLPLSFRPRPLEEAIRRHRASPLLKRVPEGGPHLQRLGPGVDLPGADLRVLRPVVDEAPAGWEQLALLVLHPRDPVLLRGGDVVPGPVLVFRKLADRHSEFAGKADSILSGQREAAAHALSVAVDFAPVRANREVTLGAVSAAWALMVGHLLYTMRLRSPQCLLLVHISPASPSKSSGSAEAISPPV